MTIAGKDSFDWPVYPTAAAFATLYQLENQNPSFGQGMSGYAKRFAAAYGDQMIGNMMTEGIVPSLLHQDPRYFRLGEGIELVARVVRRDPHLRDAHGFGTQHVQFLGVGRQRRRRGPLQCLVSRHAHGIRQRAKAAHSVRHGRLFPRAEGILARREAAFQEEARRRRDGWAGLSNAPYGRGSGGTTLMPTAQP